MVIWIKMHYEISVSFGFLLWALSVHILNLLPLWKIVFYTSAFYWIWINNKDDFRLDNRFPQSKVFKFFILNLTQFPSFSIPYLWACLSNFLLPTSRNFLRSSLHIFILRILPQFILITFITKTFISSVIYSFCL